MMIGPRVDIINAIADGVRKVVISVEDSYIEVERRWGDRW